MARKKVTLAWIANDSTRRATLKKRKKGLTKKVSELATLCNVKACMILYDGPHAAAAPEAWPSPAEAARVLARFKSMPEMDQSRKMMNQEGFLRQRAAKLHDQLRRLERDNRELELSLLMHDLLAGGGGRTLFDVGLEDASALSWMVDVKLKAVQERIKQETTRLALRAAEVRSSSMEMVSVVEPLQSQNWLVDAMNPSDNYAFFGGGGIGSVVDGGIGGIGSVVDGGFGGDDEIMPLISYMEDSKAWLDPIFPFN